MTEIDVLKSLLKEYPNTVHPRYPFPEPFIGNGDIKAIILGADPTRIVAGEPQQFSMVFELDNPKSPYWRGIGDNINQIPGLSMENVYVQNLCRNYFTKETSENPDWIEIARKYWIPFVSQELNVLFKPSVPILITTQFILQACLTNKEKIRAKDIYESNRVISASENLFGRELLALYRHPYYSLKRWTGYREFLSGKV
jgi:hypothetical protein